MPGSLRSAERSTIDARIRNGTHARLKTINKTVNELLTLVIAMC